MDVRTARRLDLLAGAATLAALAVGAAAWPWLPPAVAIHFSAGGAPGNYVPRWFGVMVVPLVTLATAVTLRAALRVDPPASGRVPLVVAGATYALLVALQALVVGWNLGYRPPFALVWAGFGAWTAGMIGYALAVEHRR